jgi:phage major head subunit gpT-like protein
LQTDSYLTVNLKGALIQARKQVDDKGILIQVQPKVLVVPPELEYIARTIVGGGNLSATGTGSGMTNDINAVQSRLRIVVLDYLTSASAWWIIDPSVAELNFFWRKTS